MSKLLSFKTLYQKPLRDFELEVLKQSSEIEEWFSQRWKETPAVLTTSVDLRVSEDQVVPIDTNIFPAGFNNLTPEMRKHATDAIKLTLSQLAPEVRSILILIENHTRNLFYSESVSVLSACFSAAGFSVSVSPLDQFKAEQLSSEMIVLNHDLSTGMVASLTQLNRPIYPSPNLGWWNRSKFQHFSIYLELISDFCQRFSFDKKTFFTPFMKVDSVDFMKQIGFDALAQAVDTLAQTAVPFVTIKADQGTYGMSVMMVKNGQAVLAMNRRQRSHMAARKGGEKVSSLLVQAGVETIEKTEENHAAEPVVYLIGSRIVGCFYRVHPAQSVRESLNSPGMYFKPCALQEPQNEFTVADRFYVYGVAARLAALAAANESRALNQSQNGI